MVRSTKAVILLILLLGSSPWSHGRASTVDLTILHLNDLHGHIVPFTEKQVDAENLVGGAAYLARRIAEQRAQNPEGTLLLAAGDMFQGTPISNVFHGQPVIEIMNALGFDAMALGNHEFDWGLEVLHHLQAAARFPFLAANIQDKQGAPLNGTRPYVLLTKKGIDVAVIGAITPETATSTKPSNVAALTFLDPAQILPRLIEEVRKGGADLVVLLSHLGMDRDVELAGRVPGIDVIVGGHTHTVATHPLRVGETLIVQAGYYGIYLGVLELEIDTETKSIAARTTKGELETVTAGPQQAFDADIAGIVTRYHDQVKQEFARPVGETSVDLVNLPLEESNIGNLIADAMRAASGAEVALQNSGGIRANIPKGQITLDQIYTVLPFDNVLVSIDLTGDQLLTILEQNATLEKRILQASGLRVEYDMSKPPGSRVLRSAVGPAPLEGHRTYRVVTNDFLAAGGDQFKTFQEGRNLQHGDPIREAFIAYLGKHSPVRALVEGRLTFLNR